MDNDPKELEKSSTAKREEEILAFWRERKIFEQTEARPGKNGDFVFYDGPPFANGLPHFGHLLPTSIKDAVPRYQTMKGKRVFRRWGWDCHGLPVENVVEKELDLKVKKDIEKLGIGKFNEAARASVLRYASEWLAIIDRFGRWVDTKNDYKTMNPSYSESVWWVFKNLYDKGLVYQGFKAMQLCPRCETTLSNFEVNQGYKDITDISVYVKFELLNEPGTYLLAWTTTPWTLPGNVALAVNESFTYVLVEKEGSNYIVLKDLAEKVFKSDFKIQKEFAGATLLGKSYKPVFDYYVQDVNLKNKENAWKVYGADFVTTEDGTGIVHIAPAFGEDDMKLGQQFNLPFIQHVATNGEFKPEVTDLVGKQVKPKDDHQATDIEIIKLLAASGSLFAKEKIVHSYPHCWRCDTPLLNYAASSWFVEVSKFKDKLVQNNQTIRWIPNHIKDGRFGKWLEGARDWAISRSRFWGAPIPVWKCDECNDVKVIGSFEELLATLPSRGNTFTLMRHGEAEANVRDVINDDPTEENHLDDVGKEQVRQTAQTLKGKGITKIIASPFMRTQETARIVAETIGIPAEAILVDERLREIKTGGFNGKTWAEFNAQFKDRNERYTRALPGGETIHDIAKRMLGALFDFDRTYTNENILVVSHGLPLFLAEQYLQFKTADDLMKLERWTDAYFKTAEARDIKVREYTHNPNYEIDVHRPYIDTHTWACGCGQGNYVRVPDVFDCWFESGSMPYGQAHYPFASGSTFNPEKEHNFPADFIAEGLDQTRGWFYALLVLSTALFDKSVFKNVIVNGLILAEDGQKMSKKLKNYPDLYPTINKYGADALRIYLLGCPSVRAEEFAFSERALGETSRRVIARLQNVVSFYELYAGNNEAVVESSSNVLDKWIISRLHQTVFEVEKAMDAFELDRAVRPIDDFIDDLSNWYIRRSRDRFKSDDVEDRSHAIHTTREVLETLSKVIAPFMPFMAEDIFQKVRREETAVSVHLEYWPTVASFDEVVLDHMKTVRQIVEAGLRLRATAGIKVRQPLSTATIQKNIPSEYLAIIADEVNVKSVVVNDKQTELVELDTTITPELKEEGSVRDLIRSIQELRKTANLLPHDIVSIVVTTSEAGKNLITRHRDVIAKTTNARTIDFVEAGDGQSIEIDGESFILSLV